MIFQGFNLVPRLDVLTNVLVVRLNHRGQLSSLLELFTPQAFHDDMLAFHMAPPTAYPAIYDAVERGGGKSYQPTKHEDLPGLHRPAPRGGRLAPAARLARPVTHGMTA